jgi:hypothetical protein
LRDPAPWPARCRSPVDEFDPHDKRKSLRQ